MKIETHGRTKPTDRSYKSLSRYELLYLLFGKTPYFFPVILPVFEAAMNGDYQIVTSELTLAELLIRPYQLGRSDIAMTYREFLADAEIVILTPISLNVLDKAAAIRAAHKTALPDAIHIATAVEAHCDVFMTNERKMKGFNGLRPVYLS